MNETSRAIYFMGGGDKDWIASINEMPDVSVELHCRQRFYDPFNPGNDPWSGQDRKVVEGRRIPAQPGVLTKAIGALDMMRSTLIAAGFRADPDPGPDYRSIRGERSLKEFSEDFMSQSFVHTKTVTTPEEYRAGMLSGPDGIREVPKC